MIIDGLCDIGWYMIVTISSSVFFFFFDMVSEHKRPMGHAYVQLRGSYCYLVRAQNSGNFKETIYDLFPIYIAVCGFPKRSLNFRISFTFVSWTMARCFFTVCDILLVIPGIGVLSWSELFWVRAFPIVSTTSWREVPISEKCLVPVVDGYCAFKPSLAEGEVHFFIYVSMNGSIRRRADSRVASLLSKILMTRSSFAFVNVNIHAKL